MAATPNPGSPTGHGGGSPRRWWVYRGIGRFRDHFDLSEVLPDAPPWRRFAHPDPPYPPPEDAAADARILGPETAAEPRSRDDREVDAVNTALVLRRPLLVSGPPGVGKSSLAHRVARELGLGRVLRWPINSRSDLRSGLYSYDPIARIHDISATAAAGGESEATRRHPIGDYLRLGPLGTALLPFDRPRVLLIDEFDKGDVDLAGDLLDVLESGTFTVPELARLSATDSEVPVPTDDPGERALVRHGQVTCSAFPFIVITSNAEREFSGAFHRRCVRLHLDEPDAERLADIVAAHFLDRARADDRALVERFLDRRRTLGGLSMDQLLNSVHFDTVVQSRGDAPLAEDGPASTQILELIWQRLTEKGPQ